LDIQPEHLLIAAGMVILKPPISAQSLSRVEPTFYLGGQPYIFVHDELLKAGPELAEMAYFETYRQLWSGMAEYRKGTLSFEEWEARHTELLAGMWHLRELIPTDEVLTPGGHFIRSH
jgi:hypothetical protein